MNRRIVLVAVAVVLALFGTLAVYSYTQNADQRAVAGSKAAQVLIAVKQVPAGTTWGDAVKGGYMKQENMPAASTPDSALTSSTTSTVQTTEVAASDIGPGQIVLRQMFGAKVAATGVLAIPKGKIAITVAMANDADVAGFVVPQSEVALFLTTSVVRPAGTKTTSDTFGTSLQVTRILLPRVSVIATSQAAPTDLGGTKAASSNNSSGSVLITLALTQEEAERVIEGRTIGQLYMGLLSDSSLTGPDEGVSNVGVFKPALIFVK